MVVDELERLLRAEPRARDLVSGYIAERIGDLSVLCECLRQLDIYQPWANGYETAMVDREEVSRRSWQHGGGVGPASTPQKSRAMIINFELAEPSDKRLFYPT